MVDWCWCSCVESVNNINLKLAKFLRWLCSRGIGFSIEKPTSSLLGGIQDYIGLLDISFFVDFDASTHGSERFNHTSFLTDVEELYRLEAKCDGSHYHKPWGMRGPPGDPQFATAQEAAYPKALCEALLNAWDYMQEPWGTTWMRYSYQTMRLRALLPRSNLAEGATNRSEWIPLHPNCNFEGRTCLGFKVSANSTILRCAFA